MTTDTAQTSAKIYQFPVGGRRPGPSDRQPKPDTEVRMPDAIANALGSAWYHDAAMQDSKRAGER